MGDFCVIETWVQSVLWPRTQLGDGPGGQKIITKVGPRCHLGSSGWTNRSHVLLLPHGGFLRPLKLGSKVYFGPGPNLVMVLESKIITKVGLRCHLGYSGGTNRSHVLLLPHGGFLRH